MHASQKFHPAKSQQMLVVRPGGLRAQADAEKRASGRRYNGLFAGPLLIALAVLAFAVFRGA